MTLRSSALTLFACVTASAAVDDAGLRPFLERHCYDCHDDSVTKGGLDLSSMNFDPSDRALFDVWRRVLERVEKNEMPPPKKERPEEKERRDFLSALHHPLLEADQADIEAGGRVRGRRLTRAEYEHTLHDLLGIDIPLKDQLPEDPATHGFATVAEGQQLSQHQLARYLDTADLALRTAFERATRKPPEWKIFVPPKNLSERKAGNYRGPDFRDGLSFSWPISLQFFGRMTATSVPDDGWYRITLRQVRAVNTGDDGAVWGTLRSGVCYSNAPMLYMIGLVEATEKPRDMVFEAWIQKGHMLELKPNDATLKRAATGATGGNVSFVGRDLAGEGYPGITHAGIDIERVHPVADRDEVRRRLFFGKSLEQLEKWPKAAVRDIVPAFARKAFRRPVTESQTAPYVEMAMERLAAGGSAVEALHDAYRAILCSPRFLAFIEPERQLDGHALASRLSYALWLSLPDDELAAAADSGKLADPAELENQAHRMLAHPRAERFIESFTDQWLQLNQIDFTSPDPQLYRTFDPVLQESMVRETRAFFRELIKEDLSVTRLIDSEFAFLNGRLVRHYGLLPAKVGEAEPVSKKTARVKQDSKAGGAGEKAGAEVPDTLQGWRPGDGLQKVALPAGSTRGGLLTQGAILKVTADGTSTSPVVRGVFVNERILGNHIPPPPPGVPAVEPDIRGAVSIRDQLEKHRSGEACASCHAMIDPPGFVLETYDPTGAWRERYGRDGKGVVVDPSGETIEGQAFAGIHEWKAWHARLGDQLARGFLEHFLTYATGAAGRFSDEPELAATAREAGPAHGLQSLILSAVRTNRFREK
jgi:hypothetical protein